jgi:hypothetical protein
MPILPFKLNQDRRHHIPKQTRKVQNWREYDASLRQRGSLTVWFSDEAIEGWRAAPRTTPGGQPWYSPLAILTALTLWAVFRLALRQTEGLIGSVLHLLGLALAVPDHTTLCRRAETLEVPRPRPRRQGEAVHLLVDSTGLVSTRAIAAWLMTPSPRSRSTFRASRCAVRTAPARRAWAAVAALGPSGSRYPCVPAQHRIADFGGRERYARARSAGSLRLPRSWSMRTVARSTADATRGNRHGAADLWAGYRRNRHGAELARHAR